MSPASEEYEGKQQEWDKILEGELAKAREIQDEMSGLNFREVEQAVFATFLHSQPVGHRASLRDVILLVSPTRPDKIQLQKALLRWSDDSHFLDDQFTSEAKPKPDGKREVPKFWRLGSKPNLKQMHSDACDRIQPDLVEAKLLKIIEGLKSLTAGTSGDGLQGQGSHPARQAQRRERRRRVPLCRVGTESGVDLRESQRRGSAIPG